MTILRTDKIAGLESVNAITGSVFFGNGKHPSAPVSGNNVLITEESSDFTFGTGDFTIEGWFWTPDVSNWSLLVGDNVYSSAGGWSLYYNTSPYIDWWKGGASSVVSGGAVTANTWHHIAFSRDSGTNRVFLDGALGASASGDSTNYTSNQITIGANQVNHTTSVSQWGFRGYVSNVRVIKGKALYTGNFTVPTRQLEVTPETVLLCCHSSQDPTQEATGKTLNTLNTPIASTFVPDVGNDHTHGTVLEGNVEFPSLNYMTLPRGTTTQSNRGRGMLLGGIHPEVTRMETYSLISSSNGVEFGTLGSSAIAWGGATGNSTRSLIGGGDGVINTIEYVTVAALGDAVDFGDLTVARRHAGPAGNDTRGIFAGGETAGSNTITNVMDYVTFASTGNAADFGDNGGIRGAGGCGSPTRAIWGGGQTGPTGINVIDYAAFATTGNTTDFGDLTQARANLAGCSNTTRAVWVGGSNPTPAQYNIIDYVTIATTGNASDFGDLMTTVYSIAGCSASHTRGMVNGGYDVAHGAYINTIQYITIASTGNAVDWGDMKNKRGGYLGGTSDSHGGLS